MPDLRQHVLAERRRRGWSIRAAAIEGGVSNTTWGDWEKGARDLGTALQAAVARAFGWPADWPDHPPVNAPVDESGAGSAAGGASLDVQVAEMQLALALLRSEVAALRKAVGDEDPPPAGAAPRGGASRQRPASSAPRS